MDEILEVITGSPLENLPISQEDAFALIDNVNILPTQYVELNDLLIVDHLSDVNSDPQAIWDRIKAADSSLDFLYDRIDDTLAFLNNDTRLANSTRIEINDTLNNSANVSDATKAKVDASYNASSVGTLESVIAAIIQMNNIWTNFGNQIATALPPFYTDDAVAELLQAEIDIQTVIDNLSA